MLNKTVSFFLLFLFCLTACEESHTYLLSTSTTNNITNNITTANNITNNITTNITNGTGILVNNQQVNLSTSYTDARYNPLILGNDTGNLGGGLLTAGSCTSGTTTIGGAVLGDIAVADPETYPGDGTVWMAYVSSTNTVTVKECAIVALTPSTSIYHVRVIG